MFLLTFTQLSQEEILLLENSKQVKELITPKEKFDQIAKSKVLKRFHFKAITNGNEIVLFDGLGEELDRFPNDFSGKRAARVFAVDYFNSFPNEETCGGHKFDFI